LLAHKVLEIQSLVALLKLHVSSHSLLVRLEDRLEHLLLSFDFLMSRLLLLLVNLLLLLQVMDRLIATSRRPFDKPMTEQSRQGILRGADLLLHFLHVLELLLHLVELSHLDFDL
jgi:hypothetical protein